MDVNIEVDDQEYLVNIEGDERDEKVFHIELDGETHEVRMIEQKPNSFTISIDDWVGFFQLERDERGNVQQIITDNKSYDVAAKTPRQREMEKLLAEFAEEGQFGPGGEITSPMPGKILSIEVEVGDVVHPGDPVVVLEAMKMENEIPSEQDGEVTEILVDVDDVVELEDTLIKLGPLED